MPTKEEKLAALEAISELHTGTSDEGIKIVFAALEAAEKVRNKPQSVEKCTIRLTLDVPKEELFAGIWDYAEIKLTSRSGTSITGYTGELPEPSKEDK